MESTASSVPSAEPATMIPNDLPFCCGSIGLLGRKPSWDVMMDCDTLLMVGASFLYSGTDITAGEYGYDLTYFERMLSAGAVDVLQADATRCCGITGFLQAAALCEAHHIPLSSHCAPALHVHPGCAVGSMRHVEYFYDHVRIENMLFEGTPQPRDGALTPDLSRAGNGLELKRADAERYRIHL